MPTRKTLKCDKYRNELGFSNSFALIVGGTLIRMPKVNIWCSACSRYTSVNLKERGNHVRFLSEAEVSEMIRDDSDEIS